jgi:hypothetical protein
MDKQWVKWKNINCLSDLGEPIELETPSSIAAGYRGTLLSRIIEMEIKHPIGFREAILLVVSQQSDAFDARQFGDLPGEYGWYSLHFVEWISSLGYHINLTGDEFETLPASLSC